ncbi:Uncharacterised protein [Mycolicibacterium vanbaalenii]|uniref:SGNH hydrolase-type esterase domain-containing protein n=1 Tax=Mycolicibacterium vanbaalenii TaxID=110539 RepID=A0A5S9MN11_MYCVN|nr:SGNH/GDSL hydrolase family protein [Mycolicibacterium vanbaalenii]CAA0078334.1 Uncharacterised protein [Mycolicibacterium vanbaalenii]
MADRLVAINTAAEPGEQLPEAVRTELLELSGDLTDTVSSAVDAAVPPAVDSAVTTAVGPAVDDNLAARAFGLADDGEGGVVFASDGVPTGGPSFELPGATVSGIAGAGTAGKAVLSAETEADARTAIGAADESASGAMRNLMSKLTRGVSDATWLSVSDSTGNETWEWVYLTTAWLASQFHEYTVLYRLWDTVGDADYATAVTVQTGTGTANGGGPFTLTVWNAAVAGSNTGYFQGSRFDAAIMKNADLVTVSHLHNQGLIGDTALLRQAQRNKYLSFVDEVAAVNPNAGVVCILQNPKTDFSSGAPSHPFEWQLMRALEVTRAAQWRGWGVIDVLQAFLDYVGDWEADLVVADGVHPSVAGQILWAALVQAAFERAMRVSVVTQPTAIPPARQLIANPELTSWESTNPDGVSMSSSPACVAAKETTIRETGPWSMKLTADVASGQPYAQWGGTADSLGINGLLANQTWTVAVRVYVPAANDQTVRVTLQDNNGSAQSTTNDVDASTRDRYCWVYVTKTFASNATTLHVRVSPRASGTAVVSCYVDRIYLMPGSVPSLAGGSPPITQVGASSVTFGSNEIQVNAEANMDRLYCDSTAFMSNNTGIAVFAYFTAKQDITINNLQVFTGSTAAAATPTLVKLGVYSVDPGTGDLTQIGVTASVHGTALNATYTEYTVPLTGSVSLTEGLPYAYAVLQVSGAAVATLQGKGPAGMGNQHFRAPRLSALVTAQTDLQSSYLGSAVGAKSGVPYICGTT